MVKGPNNETIIYQSDFKWFSGHKNWGKYQTPLKTLRAHIRYIARKEQGIITYNLDEKEWLEEAQKYLTKRYNSKIAGKRIFALPNSISPRKALKLLLKFLTSKKFFYIDIRLNGKRKKILVRLPEKNIGIAIHDHKGITAKRNLHAHVLFKPKILWNNREYTIGISRRGLREMINQWEQFLQEQGFKINKYGFKEPHFGPIYLKKSMKTYNHYVYEAYVKYRKAANLMREAKRIEEEIDLFSGSKRKVRRKSSSRRHNRVLKRKGYKRIIEDLTTETQKEFINFDFDPDFDSDFDFDTDYDP